jgi:cation:H+ antiporter
MGSGGVILQDVGILFAALLVILAAAELFTNGIEWLGHKLNLSEGVVGSVLAAVGTALPETLIPIVAVCSGNKGEFHDIGIGAIAGAPFMLTTLTMSVCGIAIMIFTATKRRDGALKLNKVVLSRDLSFFIIAYTIALLATLLSDQLIARQIIAVGLLFIYVFYLKLTFAHEGEAGEAPEHLHFERLLKLKQNLFVIVVQAVAGLAGIVWGASVFVDRVDNIAEMVDVPSVILAMIIAPVATELPEKCNSVLWVRNGKDTLALGNITGALVFQSCFPVAFGVAFTQWHLGPGTIVSGIAALACAAIYLVLIKKDALKYQHMVFGAIVYSSIVGWLLYTHLTD